MRCPYGDPLSDAGVSDGVGPAAVAAGHPAMAPALLGAGAAGAGADPAGFHFELLAFGGAGVAEAGGELAEPAGPGRAAGEQGDACLADGGAVQA